MAYMTNPDQEEAIAKERNKRRSKCPEAQYPHSKNVLTKQKYNANIYLPTFNINNQNLKNKFD